MNVREVMWEIFCELSKGLEIERVVDVIDARLSGNKGRMIFTTFERYCSLQIMEWGGENLVLIQVDFWDKKLTLSMKHNNHCIEFCEKVFDDFVRRLIAGQDSLQLFMAPYQNLSTLLKLSSAS